MRELINDSGVLSFGSSLNCMLLQYMIIDLDGQVRVLCVCCADFFVLSNKKIVWII